MNRGKIEAFKREFPWLEERFPQKEWPDEIKVQLVDLEAANQTLDRTKDPLGWFEPYWREYIELLDENGKLLAEVGWVDRPPKPRTWYRPNPKSYRIFSWEDTLWNKIQHMGEDAAKVKFVLYRLPGQPFSGLAYSRPHIAIVYKIPKKYANLREWAVAQIEKQVAEIQAV